MTSAARVVVLSVLVAISAAAGQPELKWTSPRAWTGAAGDDGSVHCLGNGRLCVYQQGPDVLQAFGPPYSAPGVGQIALEGEGLSCQSRRAWGTAVWQHELTRAGGRVATFTDFTAADLPCFVRIVEATEPFTLVYRPEPDLRLASYLTPAMEQHGAVGGFLIETPIGKPLVPFGRYPLPFAVFNHLAWKGNVKAERNGDSLRLIFSPGASTMYLSGGPSLDECIGHMETALGEPQDALLERTRESWLAFSSQGTDFRATLPADLPMRERLIQVLDDTAVMIKAQQAIEGGVLAGYPYHLGYVRDQYGVHRGLIALGHEEMSRDILQFYYDVFKRGGRIHNAQAFGMPGIYHIHENDDVEITGYIILQAFDYLKRSGDSDFIKEILPMLEWAFLAQQPHLVADMLPFNGDETYVAGGILPRSALNDGSAEATLLFVESGALLLGFLDQNALWDSMRIAEARATLGRVKDSYRKNFWRDNRLITNNPERTSAAKMPDSRHGVCEKCVTVHWTRRTQNGRYVCVECLDDEPLPPAPPEVFVLNSVSLTPLYFHAALLDGAELRPQVESIFDDYTRTGRLPSRPDGEVAVGYDYGLLLNALTSFGHPGGRDLYTRTVELADATGAWAEYYRNHSPAGTRCRPWESAINVEAVLGWIEAEYGR